MNKTYEFGKVFLIKSKLSKSIIINIELADKLTKKNINTRILLASLMNEGNINYKTRRKISIKLEENYGQRFSVSHSKVGDLTSISVEGSFVNPKYIKDDNYLNDVLDFYFKSSLYPYIDDNFEEVKNRLLGTLLKKEENPSTITVEKSLDLLGEESLTNLTLNEDLKNITKNDIFEEINKLKTNDVNIFIIGDIEYNDFINYFDCLKIDYKSKFVKRNLVENEIKKTPSKKTDTSPFLQTHISVLYNTVDLSRNEQDIIMHLFSYILNSSGLQARLYQELRETRSLCYGVSSNYLKFDNLLMIYVSLEKSNVDLAINIIKKTIKKMSKITDYEFETSIKNFKSMLESFTETNTSILSNYISHIAFDSLTLKKRIELIDIVKKEEIENIVKKLKLNSIYVLEGNGDECN